MTSLKNANRRVGSLFAVAALVLATITPGLIPAFASAAQLTNRSVELSNSSKDMSGVNYTVTFDTAASGSTGAVVLDFCSDSPLIDSSCGTAPAGFDVSSATATGFTPSALTAARNNAIVLAGTFAATTTIPLAGVHNPSAAGPLYVRISTFDTAAHAQAYTDVTASTATGAIDQGSAAVSITDSVGVSAAVLESMTFCVSGIQIKEDNCKTTDTDNVTEIPLTAPTLKLGETTGDVVALDATHLSQGSVYTQLSTNAGSGATIALKSGNNCGGLIRAGQSTCEIVAANTTNGAAAAGQPRLGVTVNPTGDTTGAVGTFEIAGGGSPYYSTSVFKLNYVTGDASGVTSPFGDNVLDTNSLPASNKNATITFGASVNAQTPAGLYANDYSLIATGKY